MAVLPPAAVSELWHMSGATFCVNDVEQPSTHHDSMDAATLLTEKATPSGPMGGPALWRKEWKDYFALPHKEGDEAEEEIVGGYKLRRLKEAPGWILVQPPSDLDDPFLPATCEPFFYNHTGGQQGAEIRQIGRASCRERV